MATIVKHKRNAVAGTAPTTETLEVGEIALNTADGYVYLRRFIPGGVDEIVRIRANPLVGGGEVIAFSTALTTTAENQSVDSFPYADYRTAKYLIQMTAGSSYQSTEVLKVQTTVRNRVRYLISRCFYWKWTPPPHTRMWWRRKEQELRYRGYCTAYWTTSGSTSTPPNL